MTIKKVTLSVFVGLFVLVLAGCGNKEADFEMSAVSPKDGGSGINSTADDTLVSEGDVLQDMPVATGNVDDTVDAIIDSSASEGEATTVSDVDATTAVGNDEDINNLNNTYDEEVL